MKSNTSCKRECPWPAPKERNWKREFPKQRAPGQEFEQATLLGNPKSRRGGAAHIGVIHETPAVSEALGTGGLAISDESLFCC